MKSKLTQEWIKSFIMEWTYVCKSIRDMPYDLSQIYLKPDDSNGNIELNAAQKGE